jgi:uncharacterized membrane protein
VGIRMKWVQSWRVLIIVLLLLGCFFRVAHLDRKVYWVDEVATSIRIAGYTRPEITQQISGKTLSPQDLLNYQQITPERGWQDSLNALTQSPEHAPLYFLLARAWALMFGSSAAAVRSLSVLFSLIALPCLYGLTLELFKSHFTASIALSLAAVSPFFVAYAQEARPYSLWVVTILISSLALLKATRLNQRIHWVVYALSVALGLYTSLLSVWVTLGQGIYVMGMGKGRKNFLFASTWAILAFIPWLWVIFQHWQGLQDNTTWMQKPMGFLPMLAVWLYSIVIIFVDFPVYVPVDWVIISAIIADVGLLALVGFSVYSLRHQAGWFIFTLMASTPLCLVLIDVMIKGQSSTAPRYLIPLHIGVQLAIASLFSQKLKNGWRWRMLFVLLLSMGVISCAVKLDTSPKYQKIRNLHNFAIAALINQTQSPLVMTESTETMDILSLSRNLTEKVEIQVLAPNSTLEIPKGCRNILLFNPSERLLTMVDSTTEQRLKLQQIYKPKLLIPDELSLTLWSVRSQSESCELDAA